MYTLTPDGTPGTGGRSNVDAARDVPADRPGAPGTGGSGSGGAQPDAAHPDAPIDQSSAGGAIGTGGVDMGTGGVGGSAAGGAGGGGVVGTGGVIAGTGGAGTGGGVVGTGGVIAGTGGAGTGGAVVGTGGAVVGTGGVIAGTGGAGTGGAVIGTGGVIAGTGGAGTGGAGTGGAIAGTGGAGLNCSAALQPAAGGLVTSFADWNVSTGTWGAAGGLQGSKFAFDGGPTDAGASPTANVDTVAQNLELILTVVPAGYAGGGISFNSCVTASAYTAVQFTISGSVGGCPYQVQLQTFEQRPATFNPPGGCASNCSRYPASTAVTAPSGTTPVTVTVPFTTFAGWTAAMATELVGVQWQVNSSGTNRCAVDIRIDDVKFVP